MDIQTVSSLVSLACILALAGIVLHVRRHAHERSEYAPVQGTAYRIRAVGFWVLILIGLPISIWLLRAMPYSPGASGSAVAVNVISRQWSWEFDRETVPAGRQIEFRVTSADVNHGLGLYDSSGRLVAQTQAMPGYVNRLTHVFDAPGTYRALCLEYCGLVHHNMISEITVTAKE